jgi:hypothetical protein
MRTLCCSLCRESKPDIHFSKHSKSPTGKQHYCKPCAKDAKLRSRYGLTSTQVSEMLMSQHAKCACCEDPLDKFVVDHDHSTGDVRGLLCNACNVLLGQAYDCTERLRKAIGYLERMKR